MSLVKFDESRDFVTTKLDTANTQFTFSTSAQAAASAVWIFIANSTTAGFLFKPDTSSLSASNISSSAAFRHIANYFFGTSTYINDSYDNTTQRTTIRCIQVGRPLLDEGLWPNSITATITGTNFALTAYDKQNTASVASPLGLTGSMLSKSNTSDIVGTVFYDHGVIVFHGGSGNTGTVLTNSASGFSLSGGYSPLNLNLFSFVAQTRNIVKRTIYFCRAFNTEFNYTTNPTARDASGFIIGSLTANPSTFITTVGLYDDGGNLLAVGKLNPAKRKDAYSEVVIKAQIDF